MVCPNHCQLGHGDLTNVKAPKVVKALGDHKVTFTACGGAWTKAVNWYTFLVLYQIFVEKSHYICANLMEKLC